MLKKLFGKKGNSVPKGFYEVSIKELRSLNPDAVQVVLSIPEDLKSVFNYQPGQYINFSISIQEKEERRSYSICSGTNEDLSVAIKRVAGGKMSNWFLNEATEGQTVYVSKPEGNFIPKKESNKCIAFAAGSGITPILSIAKSFEEQQKSLQIFYGNKTENTILFKEDLSNLDLVKTHFYLSQEEKDNFSKGRLDKQAVIEIIKSNLEILKSDEFFICGPEQMIIDVADALKLFGVKEDKIRFELFTTPTLMKSKEESSSTYEGTSSVTVILGGDEVSFQLDSKGKAILDKAQDEGVDAPYSCKGAVCCTCKAKVLEGKATMKMNYALTDAEVEEGYILTCQAHPASEKLIVSYDE